MNDPEALGGKAVEIFATPETDEMCQIKHQKKFHQLPFSCGLYDNLLQEFGPDMKIEEALSDEKYHLYKIGNWKMLSGTILWLHWTWYFQMSPKDAYMPTPDYPYDVFVSIKLTGPAYVKGSKNNDGIFVDRIILARP